MLTRRGELPRDATAAFLRDCFSQLEPQEDCYVWSGWIDAVAWLGLTELKPLVQQAFQRGSIDPEWLTFKDFEEDLQYSVDHPEAEPLNPDGDLTLFGDTVAEMSRWDDFKPKAPARTRPIGGRRIPSGCPIASPCETSGATIPVPAAAGKNSRNAA